MEEQKVILDDSPEAAVYETRQVTGWFSTDGKYFYGNDERQAKYMGSTHRKCDKCGGLISKNSFCRSCWDRKQQEDYLAMPIVEWDGKAPICLTGGEHYFFSEDDLYCYCDNNEVQPQDLQLVLCKPIYAHKLESEDWCDELPEEGEVPDWLITAIKEFNEKVRSQNEPLSYLPGDKRVNVKFEV